MKHLLQTQRLSLEPFVEEDSKLFLKLNNNPFVRKYLWDNEQISSETAEEIMNQNRKHFARDSFGLWKIKLLGKNEILGYVGLWYFFDEPQPQLMYALLEKHTQKGYAREAGLAIINYAFENLDFKYLIAATDEPHVESQKVALNLGMVVNETRIENGKPTVFYRIERP